MSKAFFSTNAFECRSLVFDKRPSLLIFSLFHPPSQLELHRRIFENLLEGAGDDGRVRQIRSRVLRDREAVCGCEWWPSSGHGFQFWWATGTRFQGMQSEMFEQCQQNNSISSVQASPLEFRWHLLEFFCQTWPSKIFSTSTGKILLWDRVQDSWNGRARRHL